MSDLIETFSEIVKSDSAFPIDFDRAWQWVGYSRKDSALRALCENFQEGVDFSIIHCSKKNTQKGGELKSYKNKPISVYWLSADCFKSFCMMAGTDKGKEVRRYFLQCEKALREIIIDSRASKIVRREFTDTIQTSPLNEAMHGWAYKQITDLIYRVVLGMDARHFREAKGLEKDANVREHLTQVQLVSVERLERFAGSMVDLGADYAQIKIAIAAFGVRQIKTAA